MAPLFMKVHRHTILSERDGQWVSGLLSSDYVIVPEMT